MNDNVKRIYTTEIKINDTSLSEKEIDLVLRALTSIEKELRYSQNASKEVFILEKIWKYITNM